MANWGNEDNASNSPDWATARVKKPANTANKTALYGNTTTIDGKKTGVFAVDPTESSVSNGSVIEISITNAGSGYTANATVAVDGNATANAESNATGRISTVNVVSSGSDYTGAPEVIVDDPAPISFNANSAVDEAENFITITSNVLQDDDKVTYTVAAGNTALSTLKSGTDYFVTAANTSGVKLAKKAGGNVISLTKGSTEAGHTLTGETAEASAEVSGAKDKGFHAGWVLRTVGTGGRAGRVQTETLVAMGSISSDGADDTEFKDS